MTRNTLISLAKKNIMAPGHQLHHVFIRAHPTLLSTSVSLRLNRDLLPLMSHIQWRKRSGYPLPLSQAASSLAPPPPILLTCHFLAVKRGCCRPAYHLRSSQTAGSKLWISPPENQDRPPARQSAPYDSHPQATLATPRKCQRQCRIAGHPDHTTDVRKNRERMWIYTLHSIAPHGIYGSNQTDSHTPHSTSLLLLWVGLDKPYSSRSHTEEHKWSNWQ